MSENNFQPEWYSNPVQENTFRRLFKWGNYDEFKHPGKHLYKLLKETFGLTDDDFSQKQNIGLEHVNSDIPISLEINHIRYFIELLGVENVQSDTYNRIRASYGKTMLDLLRLRRKQIENLPDLVLLPRNKDDVEQIMNYCTQNNIAIYICSGGSSVTQGMEAVKGGISLDMRAHMKRVLRFNELNQTITVEPGMSGPELEKMLNGACEIFGAKRRYTCGHFPQSFEFSTVGGWVVTRGAGQNSTYFGKIEDIVISQEYITPSGIIKTTEIPAMACGPDIDQILIGSEGAFGVLVSVTLKIFRHNPQNQKYFSYIFKNWYDAQNAAREIMQGEIGKPSAFRFSDAEETDIALVMYGIDGTVVDKFLNLRGYKKNQRCLFLGYTDGEKDYSKLVNSKISDICKNYGAMKIGSFAAKKWKNGRFTDPYMRDSLQDFDILIDTLECGVTWENLPMVHARVRKFIKNRPQTLCMTHISHAYQQGCNLYFIFIAKMSDVEEFKAFQTGILDAIQKSGASMSHHHGIGKMIAPWMEGFIGKNQMEILKALKKHFDPENIMNPGGTLGLDIDESKKRFANE